jgi:hypothetical protein
MREITEKRTRNTRIFDLGNGKHRAEIGKYSHTLKNGLWVPADHTIDSETGIDADTGQQYIGKSRANALDYDIKFGKNNPVWMKIKHLPSGKKLSFRPRQGNNNPDHVIVGNKITVFQAWNGIDIEIFISDKGVKTNYIITSTAGQRIVEFDANFDVASFSIGAPYYLSPSGIPVMIPQAVSGGILSYDFRNVPVGTLIDPTTSFGGATSDGSIRRYVSTGGGASAWIDTLDGAGIDAYDAVQAGVAVYTGIDGANYMNFRGFFAFDTSAITAANEVTSAELYLVCLAKSGTFNIKACSASQGATLAAGDYGAVGAAVSGDKSTGDYNIPASLGQLSPTPITFTDTSTIDVEGTTYLSLRHSAWDVGRTTPTGLETFQIYFQDYGSIPEFRPYLTVEYGPASSGSSRPPQGSTGTNVTPFKWRGWK